MSGYAYAPGTGSGITSGLINSDGLIAGDFRGQDARAFGYVFDGTTWERGRGINASIGDGIGVAAVAPLQLDSVSGLYIRNHTTRSSVDAEIGDEFGTTSLHVYNGATFDRVRSVGAGDAASTGLMGSGNYLYNGATWDRTRSANAAHGTTGTGVLGTGVMGHNGTNFYRIYATVSGATVTANWEGLQVLGLAYAFNGTSFSRLLVNAAANIDDATQPNALMVANPGEWTALHTPAAATQATCSIAAGGAGVRHVCRSVSMSYYGSGGAAGPTLVHLRDGATGAGTIKRSWYLGTSAANIVDHVDLAGLNIFGTANTAMTLEFAAAGAANTFQQVSMSGYSTI